MRKIREIIKKKISMTLILKMNMEVRIKINLRMKMIMDKKKKRIRIKDKLEMIKSRIMIDWMKMRKARGPLMKKHLKMLIRNIKGSKEEKTTISNKM